MDMYNIDNLASLSGLSRRTIHYYVQRGLLEPPEGGGRGSYYTESHLRALKRIAELAAQGVPLIHMKALLEGEKAGPFSALGVPSAIGAPAPQGDPQQLPPGAPAPLPTPGIQVASVDKAALAPGIELTWAPGALTLAEVQAVASFTRGLIQRRNGND
ncbi:MAG: MerR family transcriptional regulator [Spirochaetia bacterium]|jgi:DNA-binding transcriptional MerR regulator